MQNRWLPFFLFSATGRTTEVGEAFGLRASQPHPEVLFVPFKKVMDNVSLSFQFLILFVEGMGARDKWKVLDDWSDSSFVSCQVS